MLLDQENTLYAPYLGLIENVGLSLMLKKRWLVVVAVCLSVFLILALVKFLQIRAAIAFGESFPEPSETV